MGITVKLLEEKYEKYVLKGGENLKELKKQSNLPSEKIRVQTALIVAWKEILKDLGKLSEMDRHVHQKRRY